MDHLKALQVLKDARDALNHIHCPYFVMGGALLGFVRDNKFIDHDEDIDIGVFIEDWTPEFASEFQRKGFIFESKMGETESGLEYRFMKNDIQLDIFFWYKEEDYFWYAAWWRNCTPENIIKLKFDKFEIIEDGYGITESFNIPSNAWHWLEQIYGIDWRVSKPDWHWCSSCKNIMQAPFNLNKEKTICLGMIVKNEAHIIKECLEAVKGIINYWIIIDTGSTDNTKAIIKEVLKDIPGELIDKKWINYGHNRTEVAALCRSHGDYFLTLDADEILEINNLDKKKLIADWYMVRIKESNYNYYFGILMNNIFEWKSLGVTHEHWTAEGAYLNENLKSLSIIHKSNGGNRPNKFQNDARLLEEGLIKEPNNIRYMFYLAQTYCNTCQYEKAIPWYLKRAEAGGWYEEVCYSLYMAAHCNIKMNGSFDKTIEYIFRAYKVNPGNAEPLYYILKYCREHQLNSFGYYIGKIAETIPQPFNQLLWVKSDIYNYQIFDELSICAYYIGRYEESIKLCNKALEKCPESEKVRILDNRKFSELKLGIKCTP
jgi:tetratricopeptide (TPR) repeat protein